MDGGFKTELLQKQKQCVITEFQYNQTNTKMNEATWLYKNSSLTLIHDNTNADLSSIEP